METKPISPKWHALINYALASSLTALPSLLKMKRKTKLIYAAEAAILLPYIALTKQPASVKGLIPFKTHGKIDSFNVLNSQHKACCLFFVITVRNCCLISPLPL
jgi:hypothetical protein